MADNDTSLTIRLPAETKARLRWLAAQRRETLTAYIRDQLTALTADDDDADEWRNRQEYAYCRACAGNTAAYNWRLDFAFSKRGGVKPLLRFTCPAGHRASTFIGGDSGIYHTPGPLRVGDHLRQRVDECLYAAEVAANGHLSLRDDVVRRMRQMQNYRITVPELADGMGLSTATVYRICEGLTPPPRPRENPPPRRRRRRRRSRK